MYVLGYFNAITLDKPLAISLLRFFGKFRKERVNFYGYETYKNISSTIKNNEYQQAA